jgi:hypothetical protein
MPPPPSSRSMVYEPEISLSSISRRSVTLQKMYVHYRRVVSKRLTASAGYRFGGG